MAVDDELDLYLCCSGWAVEITYGQASKVLELLDDPRPDSTGVQLILADADAADPTAGPELPIWLWVPKGAVVAVLDTVPDSHHLAGRARVVRVNPT